MTEDGKAQMFLDECLYNAGLIDTSPFDENYDVKERLKEEQSNDR